MEGKGKEKDRLMSSPVHRISCTLTGAKERQPGLIVEIYYLLHHSSCLQTPRYKEIADRLVVPVLQQLSSQGWRGEEEAYVDVFLKNNQVAQFGYLLWRRP